jgi:hypothetical protein
MFYADPPSDFLRMGDVVEGFISAVPEMDEPITRENFSNYRVMVELPKLLVILTPCCSIGDMKISVVPLEEVGVRKDLFKLPYLEDDMTKLNRKMEPQKAILPARWEAYTPDKKLEILNRPIDFQLVELFVYAEHESLPPYSVYIDKKEISSRYYMIDFRKATRVTCKSIISPNERAFTEDIRKKALGIKKLELHKDARKELMNKILNYYRIPDIDKVEQATGIGCDA